MDTAIIAPIPRGHGVWQHAAALEAPPSRSGSRNPSLDLADCISMKSLDLDNEPHARPRSGSTSRAHTPQHSSSSPPPDVERSTFELDDAGPAEGTQTFSLPPADGGRAAWQFLIVAFVVETILWGFPDSYGVILEYYNKEPIAETAGADVFLPAVSTLATGFVYITGPIVMHWQHRYPWLRQPFIYVGVVLITVSLLSAAFAHQAWHLLVTQGLLYGVGGTLLYNPVVVYLQEWFIAKRGLANGVTFAGTAVGGLFMPTLFHVLLERFGAKMTMIILSATVGGALTLAVLFIKGRLPVQTLSTSPARKRQWSSNFRLPAGTQWQVWLFVLANLCQGFAYFLPNLYIPTFASALNLNASAGSSTLSAVAAAAIVSR